QHADHELWINRWPPHWTVERREMLAQITKVQEVIYASQQVFARDVIIKVERVEEFVLSAAQLTHHDQSLPSIDVFQDTEHSEPRATFSTQSRYNGYLQRRADARTSTQGRRKSDGRRRTEERTIFLETTVLLSVVAKVV